MSQFLTELRGRRFDLAVEYPVRAGLVVLRPEHHILAVIIHHNCSDGPSMRVMTSDLVQLYLSEAGLARAVVPPSALEFIDFAEYANRHAASPRGLAQRAYWERQLAGAPAPVIPGAGDRSAVDRQRDARPRGMATFATHWVTNTVDAKTVARLLELARETDATLRSRSSRGSRRRYTGSPSRPTSASRARSASVTTRRSRGRSDRSRIR